MKQLSELQQGDYVEYVHNTGKIKKGFTIGKSYPVLKVKEYLGASYEFIVMSDEGVKRTFKTSTDQFKHIHIRDLKQWGSNSIQDQKHPWPELNKMSPSDLLALRTFCKEEINHYHDRLKNLKVLLRIAPKDEKMLKSHEEM